MAGESAAEFARRQRVKAERLMASSERWAKGAEGERTTAAVLEALPGDRWRVLHDVPWPGRPRANIDHIVIGPAGVFVIDSKNWSGSISVRDDVLRQGRYSREGAVASTADAARAVARVLRVSAMRVEPVLCLVREEKLVASAGDVTVCSTGSLVQVITSKPRALSEIHARGLVRELEASLGRSTTAGTRSGSRPRRSSAPPKRRASRKRSGTGALVGGALAALTLAVTLAASQQFVYDLLEQVSRFVVDLTTEDSAGAERPADAPRADQQEARGDVRLERTNSWN